MRSLSPPAGVAPLDVPVPPMLEDAMGYPRQARWWAMYYAATEASWTDGQTSHCGQSWAAYSTFMNHPAVAIYTRADLMGGADAPDGSRQWLDFGSDDTQPTHYMLIDSIERRAYVMRAADCETFLRLQWIDPKAPPAPPLRLTDDDMQLVRESFQEVMARVTPAEIAARVARENACVVAMRSWLDRSPQGQAANRFMRQLLEEDLNTYLSPRMGVMPGAWRGGGF